MGKLKSYKASNKYSNLEIGAGIIGIVIGIFLSVFTGRFTIVSFSILVLILGLYNKNRNVISIYNNYFEIKPAMLSGPIRIRYFDIISINKTSSKRAFIMVGKNSPKQKKLSLPLDSLTEVDRNDFLNELENYIKKYSY